MARQVTILKFTGPLGEMSMYNSKYGPIARKRGGPSAKQMKNSPSFRRVRQHQSEFSRAAKASQLLRLAFYPQVMAAKETFTNARLIKLFTQIVKADRVNAPGMRNVVDGPLEQLNGFEFSLVKFNEAFKGRISATHDRTSKRFTFDVASFIPSVDVMFHRGATHVRILGSAATVDFNSQNVGGTLIRASVESELIDIHSDQSQSLTFTKELVADNMPVIIVAGIQYFEEMNGRYNSLNAEGTNALSIIYVDKTRGSAVG